MNTAVRGTAPPPDASAADLAQQLMDGATAPDGLSPQQLLATAWALKDACYAAWSSQPQRAGPAARAVSVLLTRSRVGPAWPPEAKQELAALAQWTQGIAQITSSQMEEAAASLERAGQLFGELGRAEQAAQSQVPRIMALTLAGHHAEAAACAESLQREFLRLGDRHSAGKVSLNLAGLQMVRDEHRQASQLYRQAAVLFARSGDIQHSVMADIGLANALRHLGELDESLRIYARARMRAQTHHLPVLHALADEAVALLDLSRGRFRDALQGLERSRRQFEQLSMPQQVAIAEKQLGLAYLELRLLPESQAQFERSLAAMQALGMRDERAWAQLALAQAVALQGQTTDADLLLQQSAENFASQGNQVGLASVTLAQAELAITLGDAPRAFELAEAASQSLDALGQSSRVRAEATAAMALLSLGQAPAAQHRLDATLQRARDLQWLQVQVQCLTGMGLAAQAQDQPDEAVRQFQAAITLFDEQRRALPCDELRSAFLADHLRPYQELLRMSLVQPGTTGLEVLRRLDHLRARALGERLLQRGQVGGTATTQALRARLNWLYRHVHDRSSDSKPSQSLLEELRQVERELLEMARRDRLLNNRHALTDAIGEFDPQELGDRLRPGEGLVEYGVLEDELLACVLLDGRVTVFRNLARWGEVVASIRAVRFQVDAMRYGADAMQAHASTLNHRTRVHLQRLHRAVWAPLQPSLSACTHVVVVPAAELGAVPFGALYDGTTFLGQRHALAMAPSAQIAARMLGDVEAQPLTALALGESKQLRHAGHEARTVAALFPRGQALIDDQATVEALRHMGGQADVIHLACHAEFRRDNPMFSALHLNDGPLTAEWVEGLHLPAAVVVLSACETGLAGQTRGDELVGLVRAFLVAGARRVVATLWPVDDAVTADFMIRFYQSLRDGLPPASALQQAQEHVRRERPHPFYWAPFVLHGGW